MKNGRNVAEDANPLLLALMFRHGHALSNEFGADKVNDSVYVGAEEIEFTDSRIERAFYQLVDNDDYTDDTKDLVRLSRKWPNGP